MKIFRCDDKRGNEHVYTNVDYLGKSCLRKKQTKFFSLCYGKTYGMAKDLAIEVKGQNLRSCRKKSVTAQNGNISIRYLKIYRSSPLGTGILQGLGEKNEAG